MAAMETRLSVYTVAHGFLDSDQMPADDMPVHQRWAEYLRGQILVLPELGELSTGQLDPRAYVTVRGGHENAVANHQRIGNFVDSRALPYQSLLGDQTTVGGVNYRHQRLAHYQHTDSLALADGDRRRRGVPGLDVRFGFPDELTGVCIETRPGRTGADDYDLTHDQMYSR